MYPIDSIFEESMRVHEKYKSQQKVKFAGFFLFAQGKHRAHMCLSRKSFFWVWCGFGSGLVEQLSTTARRWSRAARIPIPSVHIAATTICKSRKTLVGLVWLWWGCCDCGAGLVEQLSTMARRWGKATGIPIPSVHIAETTICKSTKKSVSLVWVWWGRVQGPTPAPNLKCLKPKL